MKMQTIIHVEYNGEHSYYGCIREVFVHFSSEQIGMPYSTFSKRKRVDPDTMYVNKDGSFKMRKGIVIKRHPEKKQFSNQKVEQDNLQTTASPVKEANSRHDAKPEQKEQLSKPEPKKAKASKLVNPAKSDKGELLAQLKQDVDTLTKTLDEIFERDREKIENATKTSDVKFEKSKNTIKKFCETIAKPNGIDGSVNNEIKFKDSLYNKKDLLYELLDELLNIDVDIDPTERDTIDNTWADFHQSALNLLRLSSSRKGFF